jgi:hypothetical protein
MTTLRLLFVGALAVMLAIQACAAKKLSKAPPAPLVNLMQYACGCEDVVTAMRVVFTRAGFRPNGDAVVDSVPRYFFKGKLSGWVYAEKDIRKLTTFGRVAFFDSWFEFQTRPEFQTSEDSGQCNAAVVIDYRGYRDSAFALEGWYEFESNHALEDALLKRIEAELKKSGKIP